MRRVRVRQTVCLLSLFIVASVAGADFSAEAAGPPPSDGVPEALGAMLHADGVRVKGPDGKIVAEYWGRKEAFMGDPISGFGIRFDSIPEGALVGLVRYPEKGKLLESGYLNQPEKLRGRAALVEVTMGKGRVILFGFRPQHRAQSWGTFKLLFNSILLSTARVMK